MREEEEELEGTQEALPSCLNQPQWRVDNQLVSLQRLKYNTWYGKR